jgi:LPS sulfotransferase NodH
LATTPEYKFTTIAELAAKFGADKATFWDTFSEVHFVDMVQLGWKPHKKLLNPSVVEYIDKVVIHRKARLRVFEDLKTLS